MADPELVDDPEDPEPLDEPHLRWPKLLFLAVVELVRQVDEALDALFTRRILQVVGGKLHFQREVETRLARIALATGAAAKLVVDAARLVSLGAEHVQAPQLTDSGAIAGALLFGLLAGSVEHVLRDPFAVQVRRMDDLLH